MPGTEQTLMKGMLIRCTIAYSRVLQPYSGTLNPLVLRRTDNLWDVLRTSRTGNATLLVLSTIHQPATVLGKVLPNESERPISCKKYMPTPERQDAQAEYLHCY